MTPEETQLARNVLESDGIKSYTEAESMVGMVWYLGNAIGGIKLQVSEQDADRAKNILAERCDLVDEDQTKEDEDETTEITSQGDDLAKKAWFASVLGIFILPPLLIIYSVWLLIKLYYKEYPLSKSGVRKYDMALCVDTATCFIVCLFVYLLFYR